MRVDAFRRTWNVDSEEALTTALTWRDSRGGAQFWLSPAGREHPCLALQVGGTAGHVIFFPEKGHPGFRYVGGQGLSPDGVTKVVFHGCDPVDGEEVPNRFIVPFSKMLSLAQAFYRTGNISHPEDWLEL
jgi:hypothetical protein